MVLHEDTLTGGFGAEIAATIAENCFTELDAPVIRCASLDTPVPMDKGLENQFLGKSRLEEAMQKLLAY
jgi:2-oxoisovalerate dehydrogenase E1 component